MKPILALSRTTYLKKTVVAGCLLIIFSVTTLAQSTVPADTTYWKRGILATTSFTQVSLSDNWSAGGESSVSLGGYFSSFANLVKGQDLWENYLEMGYGLIKQGGLEYRKTNDKINAVTKYGRKLSRNPEGNLYFTSLIDFRSQFAPGYAYPNDSVYISKFMAPGYVLLASGLDYKVGESLSISYAPATGKFTFVNDQRLANLGAFGVDPAVYTEDGATLVTPGKKFRAEIGSFLKINFKKEVVANVNVESRVELFSNYLDNPQNIDVNWENMLILKVNEWLSTNFITQLIYDDDINFPRYNDDGEITGEGPSVQYKQLFGIGITAQVGDKVKR